MFLISGTNSMSLLWLLAQTVDCIWFKTWFDIEPWSVSAKVPEFASEGKLASLYQFTWESNEHDNAFCEIFVMKKSEICDLCDPHSGTHTDS